MIFETADNLPLPVIDAADPNAATDAASLGLAPGDALFIQTTSTLPGCVLQ